MAQAKSVKLKTMKVGVLMGGVSSEREISLRSGASVLQALTRKGYHAVAIDAAKDPVSRLKRHNVEVAFICLHGKQGEDGAIQGFLEVLNIPYTGSGIRASSVAMDKIMTKEILAYHGIPTPAFAMIHRQEMRGRMPKLPVAVKPSGEGSTIGVTRVEKKKDLEKAIRLARQFGPRILVEEWISGREITVGILGDRPLPVVEVRPKSGFYDYHSKYTPGQTEYLVPAPVSKRLANKVSELALATHETIGCSGATRVDLILDKENRPTVLEVNTIPGMTETSLLPKAAKEAGISFDDLVERILKRAVKNR